MPCQYSSQVFQQNCRYYLKEVTHARKPESNIGQFSSSNIHLKGFHSGKIGKLRYSWSFESRYQLEDVSYSTVVSNSPPPPCIPGLFFPNPISTICKHCVPLSLLLLELVFSAFPVFLLSSPRRVVDLEICLLNMNLDGRGKETFLWSFLFFILTLYYCSALLFKNEARAKSCPWKIN